MKPTVLVRNLVGVFTGTGFAARKGRRPAPEDLGFVTGPVDVAIDDSSGKVIEIGPRLDTATDGEDIVGGEGLVAVPGFVDSHTHSVFNGDRSPEFFQRWAGRTYREISAAGGGVHCTTRSTNGATLDALVGGLVQRLRGMLSSGVTTVEVKSGYADSPEGELRLLRAISMAASEPVLPTVVPTFLGLHAIPLGRSEREYCDEMIGVLPAVEAEGLARYVDSFPDKGFFSLEEADRFSRAAMRHGLGIRAHADELSQVGASDHFISAGAASIDHLQFISSEAVEALGGSDTVATVLPATSFFLNLPYANARRLLDAGARVALATDYNPGTAPTPDLSFAALLGAAKLRMSPAEILCSMTYSAAISIGLGDTRGLLVPDYVADMNLFPSCDLSEAPERWLSYALLHQVRPHCTIKGGAVVGRQQFGVEGANEPRREPWDTP